ncbi:hypothetical protein GCM10027058_03440 [Microbacterium neimengense]
MPIAPARPRHARRRLLGAAMAWTLALTGAGLAAAAPASAAPEDEVRGTVFRDFNGNGFFDTGNAAGTGQANDRGLAGVTVTVVDGAGTLLGTTTSAADGTYAIDASDALSSDVRVEFSDWPTAYEPSGTSAAGSNGTSVQFAKVGQSGIDFALNQPADYSQAQAPIVTSIQRAGAPTAAQGGSPAAINGAAITALPYEASYRGAQPSGFANLTTLATFGEVGAVSSVVYQAQSNSVFAFATYKRQSGLGSLGIGGVYRVSDVLGSDGKPSAAGSVTPWLDLTDLGIDLGTAATNASRGLTSGTTATHDVDGFEKAGKIGVGGVTLSADGSTLFFINLHDKKLYSIDVSDPSVTPTGYTSWDLGLGDGQRPWAVTVHNGSIYVGYVDSGETAAGPRPGLSAAAADMSLHVLSTPVNAPGAWTEVLSSSLGYAKGDVALGALSTQAKRWNSWTDTWTWSGGSVSETNGGWHIYPQPILSSLYFDDEGYLNLGLLDRTAVQGGNRNWGTVSTGSYETASGGDLLIAAPNGAGFVMENNGVVGTRTAAVGATPEGPGGREFYDDRQNLGSGTYHRENTLGSVIGMRGTGEVVATTYDPLGGIRLGGLQWFNQNNGRSLSGYEQTADGGGSPSADGTFQKGGGLGAVALVAREAPVEIGNRVWFDADQDGIQDADEPSIAGVTVELRDSTGTVVATKVTDENGEYYFRSDADGFATSGSYTVTFVKPASGTMDLRGPNATSFGAVRWQDASFTKTAQGGDRAIDSNADASGQASVTIAGAGFNDHTIDAGFVANVPFTVEKDIDASGGAAIDGQEFTIDLAARDFRGGSLSPPLTQNSVTLEAGEVSGTFTVPVGTRIKLSESDAKVKSYVVTGAGAADADGYRALTGTGTTLALVVTNTLFAPGTITVTKQVTGDFTLASDQLEDAVFTVAYSSAAGSGTLELKSAAWKATSLPLPYGTVVTLSEPTITGADPSVSFATPVWSSGDNGDGTATVTVGDGTDTALTLTNPSTLLTGTFSVTKDVTGPGQSRVPAATAFVAQYSTDGGTTWIDLAEVTDGETVTGPAALPTGSTVLVREKTPPTLPDVAWGAVAFSGTGVVDNGDGTATVTIGNGTTVQVTMQNPTTPLNGQFSVTKDVTGPGATLLDPDTTFDIDYTWSGGDGTLTVRNGETATSPALPTGTVVTVTEVAPTTGLPSGAAWGTPTLTIGGAPAANGATLTIGDATTIAVGVTNPTTVAPSVEIRKGDGDRATGAIAHEADSVTDGQVYSPDESRSVVFRVVNTGPEPLRKVALTDATVAGGAVTQLSFAFPDGSTTAADYDAASGVWTAEWANTFAPGTTEWAVGDVIVGTAVLTPGVGDGAHQDVATVSAEGALSGQPVDDENGYNAFTGAIQVIKYDGNLPDPAVKDATGEWIVPGKPLLSPAQDANTEDTAVTYPVLTPQKVRWVVTNTGDTWLTDLSLVDLTQNGPAVGDDWTADLSGVGGPADYSFTKDGNWQGLLAPGASFFAEGTLTLPASTTHADQVTVVGTVVVPATDADGTPIDEPATSGGSPVTAKRDDGTPFTVTDEDPFHAETGVGPIVDIQKGDGSGTTIAHEADTMTDGEAYTPGETRTIVFRSTNTGDEPLVEVELGDVTIAGGAVVSMSWTLPDGTPLPATQDPATGAWSASWAGPWQPGDVITGTASLTLGTASEAHVDRASVDAVGQLSGIPVADSNDYNAFTGAIQVIKYDGNKPDPAITDDSGAWITPAKPLADAAQDANDADHAVEYPVGVAEPVRWVVTNAGMTWMTDITLTDTTDAGPAIGADWTADLSAFGGPADYSFAESGPWRGLLPPGASFFAQGTLTLPAEQSHADTVDIAGTVVVPAVGTDGVTPNGQPLTVNGDAVRATVPDASDPTQRVPFVLTDDDPFHARTGVGPYVDIEKGDGEGTTIANDADTMADGQNYENGETRTIVLTVTNTGDEDLHRVVLHDENLSGAAIRSLVWTLPDGSTLPATQQDSVWSARWEQTFSGDAVWRPGEVITGSATLTLDGGEPHVDRAVVEAEGIASGIPVTDRDDYNAFTSGIQVIKYDGDKADPAVTDASGAWVVPTKPLVEAAQDANDRDHAVKYEAGSVHKVRWVVTNTGSTWLTAIDLTDATANGPDVERWNADLSAFGGPAAYDFVASGTWHGMIPPGASFFAEGTLRLGEGISHADTVSVGGTPVVPATDSDGVPTGQPQVDGSGTPVPVTDASGAPVRLTDSDPFHAYAPGALAVTGMTLSITGAVLGALLLMTIGLMALLVARRRRTARA